MDLKVYDLDPMPSMHEAAGDRHAGAWAEGSGLWDVEWSEMLLGFRPKCGWGPVYVGSGGLEWSDCDVAGASGCPRMCPRFGWIWKYE